MSTIVWIHRSEGFKFSGGGFRGIDLSGSWFRILGQDLGLTHSALPVLGFGMVGLGASTVYRPKQTVEKPN